MLYITLIPARGRKHQHADNEKPQQYKEYITLIPARGRKLVLVTNASTLAEMEYITLIPARGRKLHPAFRILPALEVHYLNPRKGTETPAWFSYSSCPRSTFP